MTEYEVEHGMPADAEVVFDIAADLQTMGSWLPAAVTEAGPNRLQVTGELDGRQVDATGLVGVRTEQLRLEWGSAGDGDYAGWLQVFHAGAGASSVVMHLSFLGDQPEAGSHAPQVQVQMSEALRGLAEQVQARAQG
jgi:hypothetical protein